MASDRAKLLRCTAMLALAALASGAASFSQQETRGPRRPATVADAIQMNRLADWLYLSGASSRGRVAQFSPDGAHFVVVVVRGNLERNTNEYSLILYQTSKAFDSPSPDVLLAMSSSSNREAITEVKWLDDSETVTFLGEETGELPQVYKVNIGTRHLEKVTEHPTPIVNYDTSANGGVVAFVADPSPRKIMDTEGVRRNGIVVTNQRLSALLAGDRVKPTPFDTEELFVKVGTATPSRVPTDDFIENISPPLSVSPDGRYAIVEVVAQHPPAVWDRYQNTLLQARIAQRRETNAPAYGGPLEYMVFDTKERTFTPLFNAPRDTRFPLAWSPDGSSVIVPRAYLPLDVTDIAEERLREKNTYLVEVDFPSRGIVKIKEDNGQLPVVEWHGSKRITVSSMLDDGSLPLNYERERGEWKVAGRVDGGEALNKPMVTLEEGMNSPPQIYVTDIQSGRKALLLDLNPQFKELSFGKVEIVNWTANDGSEWEGGLTFPPSYVPGKRYPLIIQTHGFDPAKFYIDGPYTSGFASQPLAGKGFLVLQIGIRKSSKGPSGFNSPREASQSMTVYTSAIDALNQRGLIDKNRVGIIGFSRSVWTSGYALTHSNYFSAAALVDGVDAGYFAYLALRHLQPGFDLMNGGNPLGGGMESWLKNSPGFNLGRVRAPIRLESHGPDSVLLQWEWFSGLSHLQKPVELLYLPEADHITVKPWERMASQQGDVDWFCFWLKGDEDPDPSKADQYTRWRELREQLGVHAQAPYYLSPTGLQVTPPKP